MISLACLGRFCSAEFAVLVHPQKCRESRTEAAISLHRDPSFTISFVIDENVRRVKCVDRHHSYSELKASASRKMK